MTEPEPPAPVRAIADRHRLGAVVRSDGRWGGRVAEYLVKAVLICLFLTVVGILVTKENPIGLIVFPSVFGLVLIVVVVDRWRYRRESMWQFEGGLVFFGGRSRTRAIPWSDLTHVHRSTQVVVRKSASYTVRETIHTYALMGGEKRVAAFQGPTDSVKMAIGESARHIVGAG